MEDLKEKTTKGGAKWQEVTIGGVTGIALGIGSTLLMGSTSAHEGMPEEAVESTETAPPRSLLTTDMLRWHPA